MAGDVNLFFHDFEDEKAAEINVMIADSSSRRKGLAKEALSLMMNYAIHHLHASKFIAKISDSNEASLTLFKTFFEFEQTGHSNAFQETTLERQTSDALKKFLGGLVQGSVTLTNGYDAV